MIRKALCAGLFMLAAYATAQGFVAPIYSYNSSITFYTDGTAPVAYGQPRTCESVGVFLTSTPRKTISGLAVSGDSMLISTTTDTSGLIVILPYYSNTVVFNRAGVYKAYEVNTEMVCIMAGCNISPLGSVRIYPRIETIPAMSVTGQPVTLDLVLGRVSIACPPTYVSNFHIQRGTVSLSWTEIPPDPRLLCGNIDPQQYGPSFDLGQLDAGEYTVIIEDSITVGTFTVHDFMVVDGHVTIMQHPLINAIPRPVGGVMVTAIRAEECSDWWFLVDNALALDTFRTTTDQFGQFTLNLPYAGVDFEITVQKDGYFPQALYTSQYPVSKSIPPQMDLSFELLDTANTPPAAGIDIVATIDGSPAESVYVSLTGGREMLICPMLLKQPLAKSAGISQNYGGYTDRNGQLSFSGVSLDPYIDYAYYASRYNSQQSYYRQGLVRLNWFMQGVLATDLWSMKTESSRAASAATGLTVAPNPFNPRTKIVGSLPRFVGEAGGQWAAGSKKIEIKKNSINGILIQTLPATASQLAAGITWDASNLASGVYLLKVISGKNVYSKKLLLQR